MSSVKRRQYSWFWWWISWVSLKCYRSSLPLLLLTVLWSREPTIVECYGSVLSPRVVFTKQGLVQGFLGPENTGIYHFPHLSGSTFQYGSRPVVEIFKGIPYASAPTGALRYESPAPVPLRSRVDVFNANVTRPPCPRTSEEVLNRTSFSNNPIRALKNTLDMEDCLYLDIYAPLNSDKNKGDGVAVLVYMNTHVDDPEDPFDGSSMAAIGNIIVISVRYRTGVLGFLQPSFSEDVRSNFGLWDQLAALQWVQENIEEFGGNPNKITVMAYEIDATVTGLLALSPVSQAYNGLFHRLILINGSPFVSNGINTQPLKTTYQLARALRCPLDKRSGELLSCLRKVPIPQLITAAEKNLGAPLMTYPFTPIVDGTLVPHEVNHKNGPGHNKAVKEMLGKYDLLCGLKEGPVLPKIGRNLFNSIDMDRFITAAIKLVMKMEPGSEPTEIAKREVVKAIVQEYGTAPPMRELISDFLMVYPMIDLLNTHSASGKNTFFYVFKDFDPLNLGKNDEISYIFSNNVYKWRYTGSPSNSYNLNTFILLINFIANFVRTGDPNVMDPSDRFPQQNQLGRSWPKFTEEYGRYLEISKDVQFPSGYRKSSTEFWKRFVGVVESLTNHTKNDYFGGFPPYPRNRNNQRTGGNNNNNIRVTPGFDTNDPVIVDEESDPIIAGGQSSIVLIGCLLLLLNFLCFMGLFYQRERLKKVELQLRRRYIENQKQAAAIAEVAQDVEGSSSFERCPPNEFPHHHLLQTIPRDAMSETETENGFGPDFLGPNYDPRTKVNRWMQMQNANRMLNKGNSFEEYSNPTPTPSDMHRHRLSRVREDENPYEIAHSPVYQMGPSPYIDMGRIQMPPVPIHQQPPLKIQVNSLQRPSTNQPQHLRPNPPKAQPETSVQFLPQLPYQEPYRPSGNLSSDIPYADSRATSPSVISAPAGFSSSPTLKLRTTGVGPSSPQQSETQTPTPSFVVPSSTNTTESPKPTSILITPTSQGPKRSSTLIVRDLDPPDEELEHSEPKYVPVRTGTLKRSVGVDTDHDSSPAGRNGNENGRNETLPPGFGPMASKSGPSQVRVTFKENV